MKNPLWSPSKERAEATNMFAYMRFVNERYKTSFTTYDELYDWSVTHISSFWASVWDFCEIIASQRFEEEEIDGRRIPGAMLNFAENLLRFRDDEIAIISKREDGKTTRMTFAELHDRVARLAASMRESGVEKGDRIAGFLPNIPEAIIAMLATASIGALWSSCSPDFGIKGVLDRFGQIKPTILFTADAYFYNGKRFDCIAKSKKIAAAIPSIKRVIVVPYVDKRPSISDFGKAIHYDDFLSEQSGLDITFEQLPFVHPLYIMYSSGTTGLPKCMVQGAGGILINHLKELKLHTDIKRGDKIFYYTTCGWMMWNWMTSALALGATVMLYDGSPLYPDPGALFKYAEDERMTHFGTSAVYIAAIERKGLKPAERFDLSKLKAILSTGSPLASESFDYVYAHIKKDLCLSSISGGTDLNGCFALGNPMGPVWRGELQCRGLGMKVEAFDASGKSVKGERGELVCTAPFPSMPLYFWDDEDGEKYRKAYFDAYPGIWRHGDYIIITEHNGVIVLGRSDTTLNPGGVRIGTAEIYRIVGQIEGIKDSLVIGQRWKEDERVILFVTLADGVSFSDELKEKIKKTIRANATPRHVPAKIIEIADIPYTINMKKVELAVKNVIHGEPVLNREALANPESLKLYKGIKELEEE